MIKYILICLLIGLSVMAWSEIPIKRGPGITAHHGPDIQRVVNEKDITFDGNTYSPFKKIKATVRVIDKNRYFFDGMSKFSPYDILVGWGEVSDQKNLDYIHYKLKNRDFSFKKTRLPLDYNVIKNSTELWHMVSSTEEIEKRLFSLRDGHIITLEGYLVDVNTKEGLSWNSVSSPSQVTKSGNQHEIIWVTALTKK